MSKRRGECMKYVLKTVFVFVLSIFLMQPAYALNGLKLIGVGASSPVLGGTGTVRAQDTGGLLCNPASIAYVTPRIDAATQFGIIDVKLDTSNAAYGNFRNTTAGEQRSEAETVWLPHLGFCGQYKGTPWYYGFAATVTSGLVVGFKHSRISEAVTGNTYDKNISLTVIEFIPTVAYKPIPQLSLGVSPVLTMQRFKSDFINSGLAETEGGNNADYSWGGGFNVGAIYDINTYLSVGCAYKSPRWSERFDEYKDVLRDRPNMPPEYSAGIALMPTDALLIETDVKFIQWRAVDLFRKSPEHHGYGWENQWTVGIGVQYTLFDRLKLRAGYNYGRSPVRSGTLFANTMSSLITEHHLGVGVGYDVTKHVTVDFGWVHEFENKMVDDGSGDTYSQLGKGSKVAFSVDDFMLGLSYRF